jgi:hypothetical protein
MERASGVRARALIERNKALGGMAASLTQSPMSMSLKLAHVIEGNSYCCCPRLSRAGLVVGWVRGPGNPKFPQFENHPGDQNGNIGRQAASADLGALIAKGPDCRGRIATSRPGSFRRALHAKRCAAAKLQFEGEITPG